MRMDGVAAEKRCMLRLGCFARQCGSRAVRSSTLGQKVTKALLSGANLGVSLSGTCREDKRNSNAAQSARESPVRMPSNG